MDWEAYFAELEGQFADDVAAEQAAIDVENERVRQAHLDMVSRLRALAADRAALTIHTTGKHQISGTVRVVGADWCAVEVDTGLIRCIRIEAIHSVLLSSDAVRRSLMTVPPDALTGRATFGYVLRGLARHRTVVLAQFADSAVATGTIDRAGRDHCELAVHDAHTSRRDGDVTRIMMVPFTALDAVSPLSGGSALLG